MTIILNSETIFELKKSKAIKLLKKYQKQSSDYNFFINPNIGIKLFNAKVFDVSVNHIVLGFDKKNFINLFILLKNINEHIHEVYKQSDLHEDKTIYNLYVDKEDIFTIRCYLPHNKYKYHITHYSNNTESFFNLPKKGCVYDEVFIDIRNLWIKDNKVGFNLEVKETKFF